MTVPPKTPASVDIEVLTRSLAFPLGLTGIELRNAIEQAVRCGGLLFEAVVGVPYAAFGARVTLDLAHTEPGLTRTLGIPSHRWGTPRWLGLRIGGDGQLKTKSYYGIGSVSGDFAPPIAVPPDLVPVMAASDDAGSELYYVSRARSSWPDFAAACLACIGGGKQTFEPVPRPAHRGFGVSFKWSGAGLTAVTVYAHRASLPADADIPDRWMRGMPDAERRAYRIGLTAVKAFGEAAPDWHSLLCWTHDRDGRWMRAASLRVPCAAPTLPGSSHSVDSP